MIIKLSIAMPNINLDHKNRRDLFSSRHLTAGLFASIVLHVLLFAYLGQRSVLPPRTYSESPGSSSSEVALASSSELELVGFSSPSASPEAEESAEEELPEIEAIPEQVPPPLEIPESGFPDLEISMSLPPALGPSGAPSSVSSSISPGSPGSITGTPEEHAPTPRPRGLLLPPQSPSGVSGQELSVFVFVDQEGDVVADSTRLSKSTGNRRYDRELVENASEWQFEPAITRSGSPVAAWFKYDLIL